MYSIYVRFDDSIVLLSNSRVLQFSVCQDEEVSAVNDAAEIARDSLDRRYDDAQPNNNLSQISQNCLCELWGHVFQCIVFVFLMIYFASGTSDKQVLIRKRHLTQSHSVIAITAQQFSKIAHTISTTPIAKKARGRDGTGPNKKIASKQFLLLPET